MPATERTTVTWLTFAGATAAPMGLQHYEIQVLDALRATDQQRWQFQTRTLASMRAPQAADVRLPIGQLTRAPTCVARIAGRWVTRGAECVHRFDLRLPPAATPEVVTVHDLPPLRFDDEGTLPGWSRSTARQARLIICPSAFAATEVTDLLGVSEVAVVPNGVSNVFHQAAIEQHDHAIGRYVLHVGGATRRKNLVGLAEAWRTVSTHLTDVSLLLVGPPDARRDEAFAGAPRVRQLGYRTPPGVAALMARASAVVVPSTYEGFGLPALEGMAAGAPVVAARAGALAEVCGEAAVLTAPTPSGLAGGLLQVIQDQEMARELRARGRERAASFTWAATAAGHLAAYQRAFG